MEGDIENCAFQTLPSHSSQIPNEILAQIFAAGTEEWRDSDPGSRPFPVLVSTVCRHWRVLSHSLKNLWTFIVPPLRGNPTECLQWTSDWMKRSGELPISVILDETLFLTLGVSASVEDSLDPGSLAALILSLMLQCSHRLHRIDICLTKLDISIMKAMENISLTNPPLQQLSMSTPQADQVPRYLEFFQSSELSWLDRLPNLATFRFQDILHRGPIVSAQQIRCALPYTLSNLISLDLSDLSTNLAEIRTFFGAPQFCVQHLVLRHLSTSPRPPVDFSPIKVETLRTLAVSTPEKFYGEQSYFLPSLLVFPNLTYLEIDSNVRISILFGNSISNSKINTLKIINHLPIPLAHRENFQMKLKEDMDIFRAFDDLQTIELIRLQVSAKLFFTGLFNEGGTAITRKRSINMCLHCAPGSARDFETAAPERLGVFWPNLHSITLDTMFAEDVKSLIDFVKLRENVQEIALSSTAMRNLASLGRRGEKIILPIPGLFKYREGMTEADEEVTADVSEWLSKRVKLINSKRRNVGYLLCQERTDRVRPRAPWRRRSAGEINRAGSS